MIRCRYTTHMRTRRLRPQQQLVGCCTRVAGSFILLYTVVAGSLCPLSVALVMKLGFPCLFLSLLLLYVVKPYSSWLIVQVRETGAFTGGEGDLVDFKTALMELDQV